MRRILIVCLLLVFAGSSFGKLKRDPLTPAEVDQLRDTTQEPEKRIKLLVKFTRTRMLAIDQLRSDPKLAAGRGKQIHELLEDFTALVEELDDNLDMYARQRADLRKALKEVVEADSEWQVKVRTLKETGNVNAQAVEEFKEYAFALESAIEAVNANADGARELLEQQNKAAAELKKKK